MIAKQYRFHGYNSLRYVYKQGRTIRGRGLLLKYAPNPQRENCRVAVVVSKKVDKSAVARNRIRRRIYAQIEGKVGGWPACDLVFTVLDPKIAGIPEKTIKNTIMEILQISGLEARAVEK